MSHFDQLTDAVFEGDCKRIDELLAGRDVNAGTAQDNLLRAALIGLTDAPDPKVVQHLIDLGVNVNSKDHYGWTPLHYAARRKSNNADPSLSTECVKLLIAAGADVNAKDKDGMIPMHRSIAESPWNLEMVEVLLAAGAKPTENFCRFVNAVADDPEKNAVLALLSKYR
jgi:ankyrin repeat protein